MKSEKEENPRSSSELKLLTITENLERISHDLQDLVEDLKASMQSQSDNT